MSQRRSAVSIILLGTGPRLAAVSLVIALLWMGFLWATSTPGSLWH